MKRRKFLKTLTKAFAVVFAFSLVVAIFTIAFPNKYITVFAVAASIAGVALIGLIACSVIVMRPDSNLKNLWTRYSALPQEKITDFKAELDEVRKNYAADSDPHKNEIERTNSNFVDLKPYFRFSVLKNGGIYYGCLVEANNALFKKKSSVLGLYPAVIVYSTDEYYEQNPYELTKIAEYMFENKHNNILKNEREYFANVKLKEPITNGREVYITTIFVYCPHLPFGYLIGSLFPVIACPSSSTSVFIVDSKYWTDGLVANYIYNDISQPNDNPFSEFSKD